MNTGKEIRDKSGIHIEGLQVILSVRDMNVSRAFYKEILGFEEVDWEDPDEHVLRFCEFCNLPS